MSFVRVIQGYDAKPIDAPTQLFVPRIKTGLAQVSGRQVSSQVDNGWETEIGQATQLHEVPGDHFSAGHAICFFALPSSPSAAAALCFAPGTPAPLPGLGKVLNKCPVFTPHTATVLPSSSGPKYIGPCGAPGQSFISSLLQVTR